MKVNKPNKRRKGGPMQSTGAPPANFLRFLTVETPILGVIEKTRTEREQFRSLPTEKVAQQIRLLILDLAARVMRPRWGDIKNLSQESKSLAALGVFVADTLEQLAFSKSYAADEIVFAAQQRAFWPVNLQLGRKRKRNGEYQTTLVGTDKTKAYLESIQLGWFANASTNLKHALERDARPFRKAAELLLHALLHWREHGLWRHCCNGKLSPWAEKLLSLGDEMRVEDAGEWWSVAKSWMDEQWKTNRQLFEPLVTACKSKGASLASGRHELYECEVRRTVIDVRLREAFLALAQPADL